MYRVTCDETGLSINILQFLDKKEVQKQKDIHVQQGAGDCQHI